MAKEAMQLSLIQLSAVQEMANIGLGHASTALSDLTGRSFNMEVPRVESVPLERVAEMVGGPEEVTLGVYMPFAGDAEGHIAFIFAWESACALWKMVLGFAPAGPDEVDELAGSAMHEIGNIINSSFLNALGEMTGLSLHATPPLLSVDHACSIVSSIVVEAEMSESVALAVETRIYEVGTNAVQGVFLCIPSHSGLRTMFAKLGLEAA